MPVVEIMPPHKTAQGLTYRATIYTDQNERVTLQATVTDGLRRRMAAVAARSLAWMKGHVRLPDGPLGDLMAGLPPDCGCDTIGQAFRAACLSAADQAEEWSGALPDAGTELAWSFDDWDGLEDSFLPDVMALAGDVFGALASAKFAAGQPKKPSIVASIGPTGGLRGRGIPGLAVLSAMFRGILGHS